MKQIFSFAFIFSFFISTGLCCMGQDPVFDWAKSVAGTDYTFGGIIKTDANGNVYTAGLFGGTTDFDPGPGIYNLSSTGVIGNALNVFVTKFDQAGNFIWAVSLADTDAIVVQSMAIDETGNIFLSGTFNGIADFDPGPGVFNQTSAGFSDAFFMKLDAAGNFLWAKQIGNSAGQGEFLLARSSTGLYITGDIRETLDVDPGPAVFNLTALTGVSDFFIEKLDPSGNMIWAHQFPGTFAGYPKAIQVDAADNIFVAGSFLGTIDFDPGPGVYNLVSDPSYQNLFIFKLNAAAGLVWASKIGGPSAEIDVAMSVDAEGNIFLNGPFTGTIDFDPGPGVYNLTATGISDIFICKLNNNGGLRWVKSFGNTGYQYAGKMALDASANIYITGGFLGTVDFDPGAGVYELSSGSVYTNGYITILDSSGNFRWAQNIGGYYPDEGLGIYVDNSFNIYAAGSYTSASDFDPGPEIFELPEATFRNVYVMKLSQPGLLPLSLLDFTAKLTASHNVDLVWHTTDEQNTDKFIIQRSADERNFSDIGMLASSQQNFSDKGYYFADTDPMTGYNFYRLKMIDKDGSFTYSIIRVIKISAQPVFQIYPNPVKDQLSLQISEWNSTLKLRIINAAGFVVRQGLIPAGETRHETDVEDLPAGKYFVILQSDSNEEVRMFLKQ